MLQFTYPGVYTREVPSGVRAVSGAPTSVALFVGPTRAEAIPDDPYARAELAALWSREAALEAAMLVIDPGPQALDRAGDLPAEPMSGRVAVGDLLARIESFAGFTIVTTNLRHAIDPAFLRRFRFCLDFPMPSPAERLRLWQKAFPCGAPVEIADWRPLAGLNLSGGMIRNVALGAAFGAAESGGAVSAGLIEAELAAELAKDNLPMPRMDWSGAP